MDNSEVLRATELTGILGRGEMERLANLYGERWVEYRALYERAANLESLDFPVQLDFELNSSCNLRCPMCPISAESPKGKGVNTWFKFDVYQKIIDYAVKNGVKAIKLNYVNEPLIRKDLFDYIDYASAKGIVDIYLSTNGVLMNSDIRRKILKSALTRIQISIDAVDSHVYDRVRPGGDYEKVIKNTKALIEERNASNSTTPLVRVNFVKTELNEHQLNEFINLWRGEADMVGIQEFVAPPISSIKVQSKTSAKKSNFKCSFPFKQLVITNEMNVLPCCTFWGEHLSLGVLKNPEDLKIFWNDNKIRYLRKMHLEGRYSEIPECKKCVG